LLVARDGARPEAVAEEVAPAAVLEIERLRMVAVEELHAGRQLLAPGLDDQVVVVRHQAERVAAPVELRDCEPEEDEEEPPVVVVEKDRDPSGATGSDMEDPVVRQLRSRHACHASTVAPLAWRIPGVEQASHFCDAVSRPIRP